MSAAIPDSGFRKIRCFAEGAVGVFKVKASVDDDVGDLKKLVLEDGKYSTFRNVDATSLNIWVLKDPLPLTPTIDTAVETVRLLDPDLSQSAVKLVNPATVMSELFPDAPPKRHLHVIVQVPPPGNTKPASPKPLSTMSARKETVAALYNKLETYRFIQVRGTPASGKSTLAQLLGRHIAALEPSTPLIWIDGWSDVITNSNTWMEHLKKDKHWDDDIASVFIFDEAQLTYGDTGLWNTLFKSISDHPSTLQHRIIAFASYGNPTRINAPVTNMYIKELQMVTLVSIDHHDGLEAAGLYLTRSEFEELVNLRKYAFDPTCLDFIFRISSGHVGAMTDVINIISCDDSYRKIAASQKSFTMSDFFQQFTPHRLYTGLQGASIFQRGLPSNDALRNPAVAHVLRTALRENVIGDTMFPEGEESAALKRCFEQGWLHTEGVSEDREVVGYFFASPLHRLFVEWQLSGQNPAIPIQAPNLLEFVIQVIERFSPLNLLHPLIVGPYYFQTLLDAQYRDEFYRCCYDLTSGSLATLSEFGTADGRVDFYVPSKKWGIELLRDGQFLEEHSNRFSSTGQYGMTLDINEYIILDFRKKKVVRPHPHLTRLFHVVFSDDCYKARILDSERRLIREFGLLQTQF